MFRDRNESTDSFRLITSDLSRWTLWASWHVHVVWNGRWWSAIVVLVSVVVLVVSVVAVVTVVVISVAIMSWTSVVVLMWLVVVWHRTLLELRPLLWETTHLLLHYLAVSINHSYQTQNENLLCCGIPCAYIGCPNPIPGLIGYPC